MRALALAALLLVGCGVGAVDDHEDECSDYASDACWPEESAECFDDYFSACIEEPSRARG